MGPPIAVILVSWNNFEDTAECLESLGRVDYPDVRIVVVDNASTDGTAARLRARFPGVSVLENNANLGLAAGNNAGVRHALAAGAEYGLILNNDTVVDPQILRAFLAAAAARPDAAFFGAKICRYDEPRRIWWARTRWDPAQGLFVHEGAGELDDGVSFEEPAEIAYANGCALFFRMATAREIGLMDERFFVYFEEIEWCSRARRAGHRVLFVPQARLLHKVARSNAGADSPIVVYFVTRNQLLWSRLHLAGKERRVFRRRLYANFFGETRHGRGRPLGTRLRADFTWLAGPRGRAYLRGIADFARGRYGDCPPAIRCAAEREAARSRELAARDPLRGMFCSRPFEWLEIQGATATLCCPGWIRLPGVSLERAGLAQAWNGPEAQALRASILDGSFRYCIRAECPFINQPDAPTWEPGGPPLRARDAVTDPRLRRILDQGLVSLDDGPVTLNCGWDRTCNLHCRSCRHRPFALRDEEAQLVAAFQERLLEAIGPGLRTLFASGTGDPFASRVYQGLLRGLPARRLPLLEVHLHTNGQLWTPETWEGLGGAQHKVRSAHISVDATTAATYALNRRGADWERLRRNLSFVAGLRREGTLRFVTLSFVVQANNFHEMPAFISLVEGFGFDLAYFHKFCNWGTFTESQYRARAVHEPAHPDHAEFLRLLAGEVFGRPTAGLFCLRPLRERALQKSYGSG